MSSSGDILSEALTRHEMNMNVTETSFTLYLKFINDGFKQLTNYYM